MTIESLYIHTVAVFRPQKVSDGQGGWSRAFVDLPTIVGRLRPVSAAERVVAQQEQVKITHILDCAVDSDIARGDWVSVVGKSLEVIDIREPSHMGHHLMIDLLEIQRAPAEVTS